MTTMLEKATMAAIDAADGPPGDLDWPAIIRAALLAIREPSDAVLKTMRDTVPMGGMEAEYVDEDAGPCWTALIDAILNEESAGRAR